MTLTAHETELLAKCGEVSVDEAHQIAKRYNASHFSNRRDMGEKARYSIPARYTHDDDLRLSAFIARAKQAFERIRNLQALLDVQVERQDSRELPAGELFTEHERLNLQYALIHLPPEGQGACNAIWTRMAEERKSAQARVAELPPLPQEHSSVSEPACLIDSRDAAAVDQVARIIAEYPEDWEWPGKVSTPTLNKYRVLASRVLGALAAQPATQGPVPFQVGSDADRLQDAERTIRELSQKLADTNNREIDARQALEALRKRSPEPAQAATGVSPSWVLSQLAGMQFRDAQGTDAYDYLGSFFASEAAPSAQALGGLDAESALLLIGQRRSLEEERDLANRNAREWESREAAATARVAELEAEVERGIEWFAKAACAGQGIESALAEEREAHERLRSTSVSFEQEMLGLAKGAEERAERAEAHHQALREACRLTTQEASVYAWYHKPEQEDSGSTALQRFHLALTRIQAALSAESPVKAPECDHDWQETGAGSDETDTWVYQRCTKCPAEQTIETPRAQRPAKCPKCNSPSPRLHPAVQSEGEVHVCEDAWHTQMPAERQAEGAAQLTPHELARELKDALNALGSWKLTDRSVVYLEKVVARLAEKLGVSLPGACVPAPANPEEDLSRLSSIDLGHALGCACDGVPSPLCRLIHEASRRLHGPALRVLGVEVVDLGMRFQATVPGGGVTSGDVEHVVNSVVKAMTGYELRRAGVLAKGTPWAVVDVLDMQTGGQTSSTCGHPRPEVRGR